MSKRADLLAIAILSGLLARWVAKHTLDEAGNVIGGKAGFDGGGLVVDYPKLTAAYAVPKQRIDGAIGYLVKREFIVTEKRDGVLLAKPLLDNLKKLYEGVGIVPSDDQRRDVIPAPEQKQNRCAAQTSGNGAHGRGQMSASQIDVLSLTLERNDTLFGQQSNGTSGKTRKPEFSWIITHFISKFRISRGFDYVFRGGRDAKAASCLLKHFGILTAKSLTQDKVNTIDRFMTFYLTEPDREYFTGGYSLHGMWDNIAALQIRIEKQPVKPKISAHHFNADGSNRSVVSWE